MEHALLKAREFIGATAPNPPVGAAATDQQGRLLSVQAHQQAGTGHAEAKVMDDLRQRGLMSQAHTLWVTLEPCNHLGRTPPCTEAILAFRANGGRMQRVIYGAADPNPKVQGQGAARLKQAGLEVQLCEDPALRAQCENLIQSFSHVMTTGIPWVTVKTAYRDSSMSFESMIPPIGQKTFTSAASLRFAHKLRKRSDAILTGSGTVLADSPEFTVRQVPDHEIVASGQKKRILMVLDRRGRIPLSSDSWFRDSQSRGFEVLIKTNLNSALEELGQRGCLEVLVEAGPTLSTAILAGNLWNQHVIITQEPQKNRIEDRIEIKTNVHWNHPKSRNAHSS
ncbi:bifunctional diaminohydroxyphosphoribosylaminopyrimidine deaminase/5-amino-6-(5-phosphoribosylamino)uracil reductase RibD [Bdellovibrionota bacterium FG-1]